MTCRAAAPQSHESLTICKTRGGSAIWCGGRSGSGRCALKDKVRRSNAVSPTHGPALTFVATVPPGLRLKLSVPLHQIAPMCGRIALTLPSDAMAQLLWAVLANDLPGARLCGRPKKDRTCVRPVQSGRKSYLRQIIGVDAETGHYRLS